MRVKADEWLVRHKIESGQDGITLAISSPCLLPTFFDQHLLKALFFYNFYSLKTLYMNMMKLIIWNR